MDIVLDTNILFDDWRLASPSMKVIEKALTWGTARLHIPQIVLEEAKNKYREELQSHLEKANTEIAKVNGMLATESFRKLTVEIDEAQYGQWLDTTLKGLEANIPSYGDIPHADIVSRELKRRRPFQPSGRGYRDCLIWETILRNVIGDDPVYFITKNKHDFFGEDGKLHPDLAKDLENAGYDKQKVTVYLRLDDYVQKHLEPLLNSTLEAIPGLTEGEFKSWSLSDWLSEHAAEIRRAVTKDLTDTFLSLPAELTDAFEDVQNIDITETEIDEAYELDTSHILLKVTASSDVTIDAYIDKASTYWLEEEYPVEIMDADWNRHVAWGQITLELPLELSVVLNLKTEKAESFEVSVPNIYGWCGACKAPIFNDAAENCPSCNKSLLRR